VKLRRVHIDPGPIRVSGAPDDLRSAPDDLPRKLSGDKRPSAPMGVKVTDAVEKVVVHR
jgi:hypothetical protein